MVTGTVASMAYMLLRLHEHPGLTLYAGRPREDAFGRDGRCACASVANLPQCDHDTATTRLQDKGKNHDTLISLDSICLCAHNCSTFLHHFGLLHSFSSTVYLTDC